MKVEIDITLKARSTEYSPPPFSKYLPSHLLDRKREEITDQQGCAAVWIRRPVGMQVNYVF